MRLTACLIVKNEEANLPVCLQSMQAIVDEIVVVDTGSTDHTKEIAASFEAKVVDFPWNNSFADAKNRAIQEASGDWIIFLDADEYLDAGSDQKLMQYLNDLHGNKGIEAIMCSMVHWDADRGILTGQNTILRIFRNIVGLRYVGDIHEEPFRVDQPLKSFLTDEIVIVHTGYSSSALKIKFARNLQMLLQKHREGTADAMTYYYISGCEAGIGNFSDAIAHAELAFQREKEKGETLNPSIRYQLYTVILRSMLSLEKQYSLDEARVVLQRALEQYPQHPEITRYHGVILMKEKRLREALACFIDTIEKDKAHKTLEHNDFATYQADTLSSIGSIYTYMNQEVKALEYYTLALRQEKYYEEALTRLLRLLSNESAEEIIGFLQSMYDKNSKRDVEFLLQCLGKVKMAIPISYYIKIWNERFEAEDYSVLEAMLALGKYEEAADKALFFSEETGQSALLPLACAAILLGNLGASFHSKIKKLDKDAFNSLVLLERASSHFIVGDQIGSCTMATMELVLAYGKPECAVELLSRAVLLVNEEAAFVLIDRLISFGKLDLAQVFYQLLAERCLSNEIKRRSFFTAGFCAYRRRRFGEAVELFAQAVHAGYHEYELQECLGILASQCVDATVRSKADAISQEQYGSNYEEKKLHIGCGKDIKAGWINLDLVPGEGVDIVADLDKVKGNPLPLEDNTVDFILGKHVIEHIRNPLDMMEELYRVAKPKAQAHFSCPYGSSDDAFEDPTHVRQYFLNSFQYFAQPLYWRADYGYRGDWQIDRIVLCVHANKMIDLKKEQVMELVHTQRNIVAEMKVDISAVKPMRPMDRALIDSPEIVFCLV